MQKIYLLLRNNNQLGPFTIEELLDQEILPSDLVWIEGKSLAWAYASELNLLKLARHSGEGVHRPTHGAAHSSVHSLPSGKRKRHRFRKGEILPPPPPPEPRQKPAPPLMPSPMSSAFSEGDVERKAEELRQRALAAERTFHHRQPTPVQTPFNPNLAAAEENEIEFVYHKRRRLGLDIPFPQMLVGGMVIAMLVAGWYGKPLFRQKTDTVDATATPLNSTQENTAAAPIKPEPVQPLVVDTASQQDTLQPTIALYTETGGMQEDQPSSLPKVKDPQKSAVPETTATEPPTVLPKDTGVEEAALKEAEKTTPTDVTAKKESAESESAVDEEPREKKKGFLRGIFKKKKNRDNQPAEEAGTDSSEQKGQEK